jgi:hypothetical protein
MTDRDTILSIARKLLDNPSNLFMNTESLVVIELLLVEALYRHIKFPYISKSNIIGCLCKGEICKKNIVIKQYPKLMVDCEPCIDECSICFEPMTNDCVKTSCSHTFHRSCINKIHTRTKIVPCPLCRNYVKLETIKSVKDNFIWYKLCTCCDRHTKRRPTHFSSSAMFVDDSRKCHDNLAITLKILLDSYDFGINCKCNCRQKMRDYCRIAPDIPPDIPLDIQVPESYIDLPSLYTQLPESYIPRYVPR